MSDNDPILLPVKKSTAGVRTPNVFDHVAVHPAVYLFGVAGFTLAASAANFIQFKPGTAALHATNFSVWDFSLMQHLTIHLNVTQLGDLLLEGASDDNPLFLLPPFEEKRWALNVGDNFIECRPVARFGRFQLVNRGGSTVTGNGQINVRAVQ
jgi:hypothetical protein